MNTATTTAPHNSEYGPNSVSTPGRPSVGTPWTTLPSSRPQANGMAVPAATTTVSQPVCQPFDRRRLRNQTPMSRSTQATTRPTTSG